MLDKKKLIILITAVVVLLAVLAAGYYLLVIKKDGDQAVPGDGKSGLPGSELPGSQPGGGLAEPGQPVKVVSSEDRDRIELQNTAKFFVEMMGSYSSDAKFQNMIDLKPIMTTRMKNWTDDFITKNLPGLEAQNERMTTQVLKIETTSYNSQRATVLVETRRQKINGQDSKVYNQLAEVDLIKADNSWLVDEVIWR